MSQADYKPLPWAVNVLVVLAVLAAYFSAGVCVYFTLRFLGAF